MRLLSTIFVAAMLAIWPGPGGHFAVAQGAGIDPALLKKAESGDADAQVKLGKLLVKGSAAPQDLMAAGKWFERAAAQMPTRALSAGLAFRRAKAFKLARIWLHRAAEQNVRSASLFLAYMYEGGEGGAPDFEKAETYYRLTAEAGNKRVWGRIGDLYYQGKGRPRDFAKAKEYYRRALGANSNTFRYTVRLAEMSLNGLGGPRDPAAAVKLYEKAATRPDRKAMHLLGTLYRNRELPDPDGQSKALTWLLLATAFGHGEAELLVRQTDVRISRAVALEATARARSIARKAQFPPDILAYLDRTEQYFRK